MKPKPQSHIIQAESTFKYPHEIGNIHGKVYVLTVLKNKTKKVSPEHFFVPTRLRWQSTCVYRCNIYSAISIVLNATKFHAAFIKSGSTDKRKKNAVTKSML